MAKFFNRLGYVYLGGAASTLVDLGIGPDRHPVASLALAIAGAAFVWAVSLAIEIIENKDETAR